MNYVTAAGTIIEVGKKAVDLLKGVSGFIPGKDRASNDSRSETPRKKPRIEQGRPDVGHDASEDKVGGEQDGVGAGSPRNHVGAALQGISNTLDVPACVSVLFPKEANAAVCGGVDALPVDIVKGFDAIVEALKDKTTFQGAPKIKKRLGPVRDAGDCILEDIKEAGEREDKRLPARTWRDVDKAEGSATELYEWAKGSVSDKLDGSGTMTKRAKLQVVPYIVALAYASRIRVITRLVERDMASEESDKEGYLGRARKIVEEFVALLQKALERLMPDTSLLEIAMDYELPMAMYLTLMTRFRASVDAIKSPSTRIEDIAAWDDGLSSIRNALHWKPRGVGNQDQGTTIELPKVLESMWWARFTDTDLRVTDTNTLRTSIDIRELSHVLGAGSDDIADSLALRPGQKSALLQLPPASELRTALCASVAHARQALAAAGSDPPSPAPPQSFARTNAPPPPLDTLRSAAAAASARLRSAAPRTLSGHSGWVRSVAVCADGERVVSGSWDCTARLWSLHSGQPLRTFSGHTDHVLGVAVSPDGKTAMSGGADESVRVWSLESGSAQHTCQGHSRSVWAVAVSPDGRSIASGSLDQTLKLWNVDTGQCHATLTGHSDAVYCVAFSPDGETLVSASLDRSIQVWNVRTGTLEHTLHGHSDSVRGVAVTPDGRRLVSGSWDRTVKVWSLSSGEEEMSFEGHSRAVTCVTVFPDGQRIASGSEDKSIRVWNVRRRAHELTLTGHSDVVECVSVSPDGRSVVSGSRDQSIKVWALSSDGDDDAVG